MLNTLPNAPPGADRKRFLVVPLKTSRDHDCQQLRFFRDVGQDVAYMHAEPPNGQICLENTDFLTLKA